MKIEFSVSNKTHARLVHLAEVMSKDIGTPVTIAYVAERCLTVGMDELERIYDIRRPKTTDARDDYEKSAQQSARLSF